MLANSTNKLQKIQLQVLDFFSCISDVNREELDKLEEDDDSNDELGPSNNLYCDRNQRLLSRKNNQIIKIFGRTECDKSILVNAKSS